MATKKRGNGWPVWSGGNGGGGDIIIKGGSVQLSFDRSLYPMDVADPNRYKNDVRKITGVRVVDESGALRYDSGASDEGLKWTIMILTE